MIRSARQALFLVPTRERREVVAARRWGRGQARRFPDIKARERALANVSARDLVLDERILSSCAELGLRCEVVDGSRDLDASLALLEEQFQPYLPATPNV